MRNARSINTRRYTKRAFLTTTAATATMAALAPLSSARLWASPTRLIAAPATAVLLRDDDRPTAIWGYNGTVPGPTLRIGRGQPLALALNNRLPEATSVHWHGIRIDNAMDGVAGLTQDPVAPGAEFDYRFTPPDAGTFWYHSHLRSFEQVARGLYGALIVEETATVDADQDLVLVIDDWSLTPSGALAEDSFGNMHDISHAGRMGNWVTVNGEADHHVDVVSGQRLRLRLVNAATARILPLSLGAQPGWIVALDGQPLRQPQAIKDTIRLSPGQRADVIVDMTHSPGNETTLIFRHRDTMYDIVYFKYHDTDSIQPRPEPPEALPQNTLNENFEVAHRMSVDLVLEGGAMGSMQSAQLDGQRMGIRELVERGYAWSLNGVAGMPDEPLFRVAPGQTMTLRLRNDTRWPHAMHVHGHHFKAGALDDSLLAAAPWRDTVTVDQGESIDINFVADNPGKWLLHCHMLEHSAGGMMTWFEVA